MADTPERSAAAHTCTIIPFPPRLGLAVTLGRFDTAHPDAIRIAELIRLRLAEIRLAEFNAQIRKNDRDGGPDAA